MLSDSPLIVEPSQSCTSTIIWLHGLGANANDFACLPQMMPDEISAHMRFILPNAPMRPVTLNGGMQMPAWYDIISLDRHAQPDQTGLDASHKLINTLIDEQIAQGISPNRIFLGGFSQGGAQILYSGTKTTHQLGGLIGLSCYLPVPTIPLQPKKAPILMMHGQHDPVVLCEFGEASAEILQQHHYDISFQTYPVDHSVCDAEFTDLGTWLSGKLSF